MSDNDPGRDDLAKDPATSDTPGAAPATSSPGSTAAEGAPGSEPATDSTDTPASADTPEPADTTSTAADDSEPTDAHKTAPRNTTDRDNASDATADDEPTSTKDKNGATTDPSADRKNTPGTSPAAAGTTNAAAASETVGTDKTATDNQADHDNESVSPTSGRSTSPDAKADAETTTAKDKDGASAKEPAEPAATADRKNTPAADTANTAAASEPAASDATADGEATSTKDKDGPTTENTSGTSAAAADATDAGAGSDPSAPDAQTDRDNASGDGETTSAKDKDSTAAEKSAAPADRKKRRRRIWRRVAIGATALVAAAAVGVYWLYADLMGGIEKKDVTDQLGTDRPKKLNKSLNILLIGSDTREGENARYGAAAGLTGARSDTAILLHLSPNRDQAVGISFPRDSMVQIPDCKKEKGGTVPGRFGMLNTAFAFAGPTCTWKTLEKLTGIHIDHFVQVDFAGFKRVVDALGGVEICVDRPVNDPRAELVLKAGKQTVKGEQALGYVRARYTLGNGSDLERIERQQKFMASVVDKATSSEVLTDPAKTYKFLKAVSKSVTTDEDLDFQAMRKLAEGLRGLKAGQVRFVTVPVERYEPDPNRVQWNEERARPLFEAIRHDSELPAEQPPAPKPAVPSPDKVKVTVVDAGAKDARGVARRLRNRGFKVDKKIKKEAEAPESRIIYNPSAEGQASALAAVVPNAVLTADGNAPADHITLVIGRPGVRLAPPAIDKIAGGVKAGKNPCK